VDVFDRLSQGQKQVAILTVAKALLDVGTKPPPVNAVLAGTVDAIYRDLQARIETEISFEDTRVRKMVLEAIDEMDYWTEVNNSLEPGEELEEPLLPDSIAQITPGVKRWAHGALSNAGHSTGPLPRSARCADGRTWRPLPPRLETSGLRPPKPVTPPASEPVFFFSDCVASSG
jgi:hypothetical protein